MYYLCQRLTLKIWQTMVCESSLNPFHGTIPVKGAKRKNEHISKWPNNLKLWKKKRSFGHLFTVGVKLKGFRDPKRVYCPLHLKTFKKKKKVVKPFNYRDNKRNPVKTSFSRLHYSSVVPPGQGVEVLVTFLFSTLKVSLHEVSLSTLALSATEVVVKITTRRVPNGRRVGPQ